MFLCSLFHLFNIKTSPCINLMDSCSNSVLPSASPFDTLLFDLDDTLYSSKLGIAESLRKNIDDFLVARCGFEESKASSLRSELFKKYGSSLAGLRALGYDIEADEYHRFVHGKLPYDLIKPNFQLRDLLRNTKQRKIIFTNSDKEHAIKVLKRLDIEECFDQIICFETLNPNLSISTSPYEYPVLLKPSVDAFKVALDSACIEPHRTLFLEDNAKNVAVGKAMGLYTALVGKTVKSKEADYVLENINELAHVIPEIWTSETEHQKMMSSTRTEVECFLTTTTTKVGA